MNWLVCLLVMQTGAGYLAEVGRADSLYYAGRHHAALVRYRAAHELVPSEPGPLVGIGWTMLQLGRYHEAETTLQRVLASHPDNVAARQGLALIPGRHRFKLTGHAALGMAPRSLTAAGFVNYVHHHRTSVTAGLQYVRPDSSWQGFNTVLVLYRQLAFPWSARLDLVTMSSTEDPRYWQVVYAPAVSRSIGEADAGITLVGWNSLQVFGFQLHARLPLASGLSVSTTPALNSSSGTFGWFVPAALSWQPWSFARLRALAGTGSILNHVDLDVPTAYDGPVPFTFSSRLGIDLFPAAGWTVSVFGAVERYAGEPLRSYASVTLSKQL